MMRTPYRLIVPKRGSFPERGFGIDNIEYVEFPDNPISNLNALLQKGGKSSQSFEYRDETLMIYSFGKTFGLEEICAHAKQ
jgi:hypothetical protein